MKRIYQKIIYFLKDDKFLKLRRQIFAWFSIIIFLVTIALGVICIPWLFAILIQMDATEKFALSEDTEILQKSFFHLLGIILFVVIPLIGITSKIDDYWDEHYDVFVSFLTGKDTPKNEDH